MPFCAGGAGVTVIVTDLVALPAALEAVRVYVVVALGVTDLLVKPRTLPTPLSMLKVVGASPDKLQDSVED